MSIDEIFPPVGEWLAQQTGRTGCIGRLARGEEMSADDVDRAISRARKFYLLDEAFRREYEAKREARFREMHAGKQ